MSKAYLDRIGMPGSCLRDEDDIAALRQQRAEAQAQQEAQQQAAAATQQVSDVAAAAKNLGQAPTGADGQTLLGTILGGLGGM